MPFSPDTGKPRTARRGRANPHGSGSVVTPLTKHLLSQVPPAGAVQSGEACYVCAVWHPQTGAVNENGVLKLSIDSSVHERGEPSPPSRPAATVGTHEGGVRDGRSSSSLIEREIELVREKERLVRLELHLERIRAENRPRTSGGGAELNLRMEVLSFSRLMKDVFTQMPSSELFVPSWFDGVENVFATYEVLERLRGLLVRPYFTERMRALVNRPPVGDASDYGAVKGRVLLQLKLSPAEYRRLFLKATRMEKESWT
ncbi:hypothetical protein HPB47_016313 [Ixodes persulcatus]|uniref:Uncharacterized protein n=1 Tax=Ixodes persulcatus TaxID=34615 RepID=A0AC60QRD3_IXOPE|nr:hypothetical protein HPB47_016313 [Ixodes persulcatus]